jgi:hypothetical protein
METSGVPNDLMPDLNAITVLLCLPLATHGLYPLLRKLRISFPPVTRIALGFLLEAMAMGFAAGVQGYIYASPANPHLRLRGPRRDLFKPGHVRVCLHRGTSQHEGCAAGFLRPHRRSWLCARPRFNPDVQGPLLAGHVRVAGRRHVCRRHWGVCAPMAEAETRR